MSENPTFHLKLPDPVTKFFLFHKFKAESAFGDFRLPPD
jgi:hypothetical protein